MRDAEHFRAGFSDDATVVFTGPFAPKLPDGSEVVIPSGAMLDVMKALKRGFSDFGFNKEANAIEKTADGAWTVTCFVRGTHDGPFTVPGMDLPELEPTGKECVMGEEKFTFYVNDAGLITKKVVEPLADKPTGPPGFYTLAGGTLPQ